MVKDAKDTHITGRIGKLATLPAYYFFLYEKNLQYLCCVCCEKKSIWFSTREKERGDIYISGWCGLWQPYIESASAPSDK